MSLQRLLVRMVGLSRHFALWIFLGGLALATGAAWYAVHNIGVTTDTDLLFSSSLPWRQRQIEFAREFPQMQGLLVAVVSAKLPEEADATAAALAARLEADHAHFQSVTLPPNALPFFKREGFLFLPPKQLESLLNSIIDAQPFLGQLAADPSARGLFAALSLLGMGVDKGQADLKPYLPTLHAFDQALAAAASGHPEPLSWQELLAGPLVSQGGDYRFVLAQPRLDFNAIQPGGAATRALKAAAASLPFVKAGGARVNYTGSVALADEEFATVEEGVVAGSVVSVLLIILWLILAVRSWRMVLSIFLTLALGFCLTTGFATLAVGTLNLISIAFTILFIGIAVDFAIQFCVRFRESRLEYPQLGDALAETAHRVGLQILVAATATAAGFYAFVPTSFEGVAELGLIAGTGMLFAFLCTMVFLPACLTLLRPGGEGKAEIGFSRGAVADRFLTRHRRPVLLFFGAVAVLGMVLTPHLEFDSDPLHTKNPNTEAMRTLRKLMNDPQTNPYTIDIMEPSVTAAAAVAERLDKLPLVSEVLTVESFVPKEQKEKLAQIADAATILGPTLAQRSPPAPVTSGQLRLAVTTALGQLAPAALKLGPGNPLAPIVADLRKLAQASDAQLLAMNAALTEFLPAEIEQLREALQARPVTLDDLPASIRRDWLLPNGRARVEVIPKPAANGSQGLHEFVAHVQAIAPNAQGSAVTIVDTSHTIVTAFRDAAAYALAAIAVILLLALKPRFDALLVLAPLLLSGLMTVVVLVLVPMPLNFANIIALPLLLGVGVSFNIYFVMNWRGGARTFLSSATARAVLFSALTTSTAFGSLAASAHPGTASMGDLLLISLGCTLVASLMFEPALLCGMRAAGFGWRVRQRRDEPVANRRRS